MAQEVDTYSFANNFWGKDDNGVQVLFQRMNDSKQTLDEIQAFVKERIAIEEEYARKLQVLSRRALGTNEIGSLKEALDVIKTTTESTGKTHADASQQFKDQLAAPLDQFTAQSRTKRKSLQATVDKFGKAKLTQTAAVEKARQKFEMDSNKINGYSAQKNLLLGKELEKNNAKLERANQSVDSSKRDYQNGLRVLAENTDRWNKEWKHSCDIFQDMEEERIDFLKSNLWNYTNIVSSVCVSDDEGCENIRVSLEKTDIDKDIELFVKSRSTGAEIYHPPEFINYLDGEGNDSKGPNYKLANFARESSLDYEENSQEPGSQPLQEAEEELDEEVPPPAPAKDRPTSLPPATQAPQIRKPVESASPASGSSSQRNSVSPVRKPVPSQQQPPPPQQASSKPAIPQLSFNDDSNDDEEDEDYQSIPVLAHPESHPSTAQSSPIQGASSSPNSSVYSNNTSISSQSDENNQPPLQQKEDEPKRRTWSSPFRRRSKKDLTPQKSWGSIGRNNSNSETPPAAAPNNNTTITAKSGMGKRFVEQQSTNSGQTPSSVLNMGENMFDLGVSRPQGSKSPFDSRPRSSSPTKNMSKDDPLVAALARLKDSMPDEDEPQQQSTNRYGSVGGGVAPSSDMGPKRVSSRSAPVSPVKNGPGQQQQQRSALVPPQPAFTASEMEATSGKYSNQTKELFGGGGQQPPPPQQQKRSTMQRPKSQADMRFQGSDGGRSGYDDGYYNTMPSRPKTFYHQQQFDNYQQDEEDYYNYYDNADEYNYAPPPPPQPQSQSRNGSYRHHHRSKSASPLKGNGGSINGGDPYRSASPMLQQNDSFARRGGGRTASPAPQQYPSYRSASPGPPPPSVQDPYRSASPKPQQHDSFRRSRSPGPPPPQQDPYGRSPSPQPQQDYRRSHSPAPQGNNYYRSASPGPQQQQYHQGPQQRQPPPQQQDPRQSMRPRSKSAVDLQQSNSQMRHSQSLPSVSSDGRKVIRYSKAAYDYRAAIPEEVTFRKGDILLVLLMQEDGWWEVEVLNSRRRFGLAPSNFLVNL